MWQHMMKWHKTEEEEVVGRGVILIVPHPVWDQHELAGDVSKNRVFASPAASSLRYVPPGTPADTNEPQMSLRWSRHIFHLTSIPHAFT